jgi:hypothetical protein
MLAVVVGRDTHPGLPVLVALVVVVLEDLPVLAAQE